MKMGFQLALQFLTKVPLASAKTVDDKVMARSMAYFSLIGLLIGGATAGVYYLLSLVFSSSLAILGAIIMTIFITGNLHGDGLMDTADGIFSGRPREKMLEIMKDSRVGSHGVIAGVLVVLLRFVLLGELDPTLIMMALVLAPVLGRWAQVFGAVRYDYIRTSGIGVFTDHVGGRELAFNSIVAIVAGLVLFQLSGTIIIGVALAGAILFFEFIKGKLGGVTGDTLGAANESIEILTLLMIVLMASFL